MIVDENEKTEEEVCNEIINSNISDKAKVKAIQALKNDDKKIEESKEDEMVIFG